MKEQDYDNIFKYLKVGGLLIAIGIVTASSLKAFYEPADVHLDVERIEQEVKDKEPKDDRFPDVPNGGGWVQMEWIKCSDRLPPTDGTNFLCVFNTYQVRFGCFARHYDTKYGCPSKRNFYYLSDDPEEEGYQILAENVCNQVDYWMPLPKPPREDS